MFKPIILSKVKVAFHPIRLLQAGRRCYAPPKTYPSIPPSHRNISQIPKKKHGKHIRPLPRPTPPHPPPSSVAHIPSNSPPPPSPSPPRTVAAPEAQPASSGGASGSRQGNKGQPPPSDKKESLSKLIQERKIPFFGLALLSLWMSYYIGKLCVGLWNSSNADVQRMTAGEFDRSLDFPEWFMGITTLRSRLARRARGQVLEVAVGTGRNMVYFNWNDPEDATPSVALIPNDVQHYTGIDISDDMLAIAIKRARGIVGGLMTDEANFRLVHGDVQNPLPRPPDGKSMKYDTVIQSFGLCSVEDPVELVKNLATMVKPNFGRILLLEHGRGSWGIVNRILDSSADKHFEKHACWWNRDIEKIVKTAVEQVPGLEIRRLERPNWLQAGTVLLIELRVKHQDSTEQAQKPKTSGWWFGWLGPKEEDDD